MKRIQFFLIGLLVSAQASFAQLIVDHLCTDIAAIPQDAILNAKSKLHIAYGHTSHGSQLIDGMNGLIEFANNGGRGIDLTDDIFTWNHGGSGGALDLHDHAMNNDVGYYPDWYTETVAYLNDQANSDVNVVLWSWCGQVDNKYADGVLWEEYLDPMLSLEQTFQDVVFVYMTGHLEYWERENVTAANDSIRSFCRNNNKVLFDFADIESYGPDGTCYKETGDDACDYYDSHGDSIGNWAIEYQNSHTEGQDWYQCGSQHSEPLNANLKAYASWWMFASLGGWNYVAPPLTVGNHENECALEVYPNPVSDELFIKTSQSTATIRSIEIITMNGKPVRQINEPVNTYGERAVSIDVSDLCPGMYILNMVTDANSINKTFTISH